MFTIFDFVGYSFTQNSDQDCLIDRDLHFIASDSSSDYENCKQWCANNNDCGAFTVWNEECYVKRLACKVDLRMKQNARVYLKETV